MNLSSERLQSLAVKAKDYAANVDTALPYLMSRGITKAVAEMFQLGYVLHGNGNEHATRLSIPYVTQAGVVTIKYRCTDMQHGDHKGVNCPKYLHEAGSGTHLFNARVLITASAVVITEGELDAICVQAYCGIPAVAYPGVDTWGAQPHWRYCFEGIPEVIVVADGDQQGREAARSVAESLGNKARVVSMPAGEDANSFLMTQGASAFAERLNR